MRAIFSSGASRPLIKGVRSTTDFLHPSVIHQAYTETNKESLGNQANSRCKIVGLIFTWTLSVCPFHFLMLILHCFVNLLV